jgi:hypothetical protein
MGNVVAGSAIRKGMNVSRYVMQHPAMSAQAYDPDNTQGLLHPHLNYGTTPDTETNETDPSGINRRLGLNGVFNKNTFGTVYVVNFCLPRDFALDMWIINHNRNKPSYINNDGWYGYNRLWSAQGKENSQDSSHLYYSGRLSTNAGAILGFGGREVRDMHEAMAFVSRSITGPVGSNLNARGSIASTVNLDDYHFEEDHSAEWNRRIQVAYPYWEKLFKELKLNSKQ